MTRARFDVYLNSETFGTVHAADLVVLEAQAAVEKVGFRYRPAYLELPGAFAIDPLALPLGSEERQFDCRGGIPAFLDDYLPDAWGRQVLTYLAYYRDQNRFNANSVIDTLRLIGANRIGALCIVQAGQSPSYAAGSELSLLSAIEETAWQLQGELSPREGLNELGLLYLGNYGSGVGGARPKALLTDGSHFYLGKFNHSRDPYNNARVELACLLMAQAAGVATADGRVLAGVNGREVLLLDRFDITTEEYRHHLISVNGLMKEPQSQRDYGGVFRYDDIRNLVECLSVDIKTDSEQLLRLMLFNRAIHNTDDHARNFSFLHRGEGYRLAPAYDLVPSLSVGEYHAAGYGYRPDPPTPTEARSLGRVLKLPKPIVHQVADEVVAAVECWQEFAERAGVGEQDAERVLRVLAI